MLSWWARFYFWRRLCKLLFASMAWHYITTWIVCWQCKHKSTCKFKAEFDKKRNCVILSRYSCDVNYMITILKVSRGIPFSRTPKCSRSINSCLSIREELAYNISLLLFKVRAPGYDACVMWHLVFKPQEPSWLGCIESWFVPFSISFFHLFSPKMITIWLKIIRTVLQLLDPLQQIILHHNRLWCLWNHCSVYFPHALRG